MQGRGIDINPLQKRALPVGRGGAPDFFEGRGLTGRRPRRTEKFISIPGARAPGIEKRKKKDGLLL